MTGQSGTPSIRYIFVDTSAFFAMASRQDTNFDKAQRILDRVGREGLLTVTTTYIVAEAHALFLARRGRATGVRFLLNFETSGVTLVRPSAAHEASARAIIYRYTDKDFSLTDAISFVIMEELGISTAFTFDRDFQQYGFAVLKP